MSEFDHSDFIQRLQNGEQSALKSVLTDVVPVLWPLLAHRFRESLSNEDIEDIVASSLSKLWQNRKKFDSKRGDFHGWFYVILRNSALDLLRKRAPKVEEFLTVVPLSEASETTDMEKKRAMESVISTLSEREQQVLLPLFDKSGVSVAELGDLLSLSFGAVRQLRFRALRKVEKKLAEFGYAIRRVRASVVDDSERKVIGHE